MPRNEFEIGSGNVIGRDHRMVARNCQDGAYVIRGGSFTIGIVTDGCGSGQHSEVGAKLGARLIAESVRQEVAKAHPRGVNWQRVRQHVLAGLDVLTRQMGGDYRQTVEDYFLFTVVGFVLTDSMAAFFALGDGVVVVNGTVRCLGPFPDNAPPYIGYGLIGDVLQDRALGDVQFEIIEQLDTEQLENFLIGSDGVIDLMGVSGQTLPGSSQVVGGIEQFWSQDSFFANPELINRRLKLIARDWPKREPEAGKLPDDTTIIVGRRNDQSSVHSPEEG